MPTDIKPLFRPEAIRPKLDLFRHWRPSESAKQKLREWATLLATKEVERRKETELLPNFIRDIFEDLLGYVGAPAESYTLRREALVQVDGKRADAALGRFHHQEAKFVGVLEGKGPRDPLDRPFAGRSRSAVEQALKYAVELRIDWYLVTNLHEVRLYHKGNDTFTYESFKIEDLTTKEQELRRFVYLLGAERVLAEGGNHLDRLLAESKKIGREMTNLYYAEYRKLRENSFDALRRTNPTQNPAELIAATQKILDRVLFVAFCEDRGLLPRDIIEKAYRQSDPFNPRPIWQNFLGLFRAVDKGNETLNIGKYNGGLFAPDPFLESLAVPDSVCEGFKKLAEYEYGTSETTEGKLIDVEILGHIFEQSISDLEELQRAATAAPLPATKEGPTKRKKEGAFYTPEFVTRYIVAETLGPVLREKFEAYTSRFSAGKAKNLQSLLADPTAFDPDTVTKPQKAALIGLWSGWLEELETVRIVDPACGSGAFLMEAFDQMFAAYGKAQGYLSSLEDRPLFDIRRTILTQNLFGMDLNAEAVEIARLSCWIKTAEMGKELTSLDANIKEGNSVVLEPSPLEGWKKHFPEVFKSGGFDVVIGNPPYVRHEWIKADKPYLEKHYVVFDSAADLYVYFFEIGLNVLRPGGRLGFISSNSFVRAGYAKSFRSLLTTKVKLDKLIDLGDTQVFADAKDVYPAIVVFTKSAAQPTDQVSTFRFRKNDPTDDIRELVKEDSIRLSISQLNPIGWQFDIPEIAGLRRRLVENSQPLDTLIKGEIYMGLKTGLNEAFVVNNELKAKLIEDGRSRAILKPFVGGQNLLRWYAEDSGNWLIMLPSGTTTKATGTSDPKIGREWLKKTYPAVEAHLAPFEVAARKRTDKGQFWWELRACDYYDLFEKPKIMYPDIAKYPRFVLDRVGIYSNNTTYFVPSDDLFLLAALNSEAIWFALSGISIPFGERAGEFRYRLFTQYMEKLPIPDPSDLVRGKTEKSVRRLIDITAEHQSGRRDILDWLRVEFGIEKPTQKLEAVASLDVDGLTTEVKKIRGKGRPLSVIDVRRLKEEHAKSVVPLQTLIREATGLERRVSDLVNEAFGLTPDEIALIWQTAPPLMPGNPPVAIKL